MPTITIVSQVIGFISFGITLLTLIGVYRDLISTIRTADKDIPIVLGNLRQEIEVEKILLKRRLEEGDPFGVFVYSGLGNTPFARRRRRPNSARLERQSQFTELLAATVKDLWQRFKNLERPFLIRSPIRAEAVRRGDYWGESDVDEKVYAQPERSQVGGGDQEKSKKNWMGMQEMGLAEDQKTFYRTDLTHRFIWWQSKSDAQDLQDQVQRIQIRRIERDAFETDDLVKRCLRILQRGENAGDGGRSGGDGSGSGSGSDGGGGRNARSARSKRGSVLAGSRRGSRVRSRRGSPMQRGVREVIEREVIRRRPEESPDIDRRRPSEPSNTGKRRDRAGPRVEYEIVRPGNIYIDVDDGPRRGPPGYTAQDGYRGARERSRRRGSSEDGDISVVRERPR